MERTYDMDVGFFRGVGMKVKAAYSVLQGGYGVCLDGDIVEARSFRLGHKKIGNIGTCPIEGVPIGEVYVDKVGYFKAARVSRLLRESGLAVKVCDSR